MSDCFIYFYMNITQNFTLSLEHRISWGVFQIIIESGICFVHVQVKASLLNYMHNLVLMMNDTDFVNSADTRLVLSRIINFTTEPKSVEVRKVRLSSILIISLLNAGDLIILKNIDVRSWTHFQTHFNCLQFCQFLLKNGEI